ncbi:hypothetical protein BHYA_0049g00630 [Botrytis hyacinthi]|uniref:Uncharacterized protein n=1 Tax=Botrytis hyacinthi TaxID=278943 RepID=A0A4Z1H2Z5_9HELO|nr:hypothetical protein BHYA_0049g00630 [Botrytis hyacinthi]
MNPNDASEKSAADQAIQIPLEHNAHHDLQQADRNSAIDQIAHTEEVIRKDAKVDMRIKMHSQLSPVRKPVNDFEICNQNEG